MNAKPFVKRLVKQLAWALGFRRTFGNYGVERQDHLGGYWKGGDPNTYCPELWQTFVRDYAITSVIDVGCGEGYSTKYFSDLGLTALGVEGGALAIKNSIVPHLTVHHDYTKGPYVPKQRFDMVWCCEFVEHVEERFVGNFLATFANAKYCLMTHAFPGQTGYHHVNCQTPDYWIGRLAAVGFRHDEAVTNRLRGLTTAEHVTRSLLFFEKRA
jgi:SAM-dependent methyltransferase